MNSSVNCSIAFHNVNKTRATTRLEQQQDSSSNASPLVVTSKVVTYRIVLLQKDYAMTRGYHTIDCNALVVALVQ